MIHANWNQLKRAYSTHSGVKIDQESLSFYLLLFYAIEAGLKSIYLRENKLNTTQNIPDDKLKRTHDLSIWVKELRFPASVAGCKGHFRLERDSTSWQVQHIHEAWRYHVNIEKTDQQEIVAWLKKLKETIKERIGQ